MNSPYMSLLLMILLYFHVLHLAHGSLVVPLNLISDIV